MKGEDSCAVSAPWIQTGQQDLQVVNDFGPLSNAELLRRYGFVECSTNPHDCVEFSYEDVVQVLIQLKDFATLLHILCREHANP